MAGTGVAYPADAVSGSPTFTSLNGRNAFAAAMAGATASKPLGGISGVRPGTPATTVTATSTTWTAQPFAGYIELEASGTNSGYFFAFGGVTTGAVTAAGGSARTDIVWVQIADSNTSDGSTGAPRVIIDYTANTTTPPARGFVIAQINVPASGGGAPTVTWVAPYTVAAGGILPVPAGVYPASSYAGQYIDDPSIGLMRSNGTSFKAAAAASSVIIPTVSGSGATVDPTGLVVLAGAATVSLNGLTGFRKVRLEVKITAASVNNQLKVLVRSTTADDVTANYDWQGLFANNTTVTAVQSAAQTAWSGMLTSVAQTYDLWIELEDLDQARMTRAVGETNGFSTSSPAPKGQLSLSHRSATAWDGVTVAASTGTVTGTIRVLGIL